MFESYTNKEKEELFQDALLEWIVLKDDNALANMWFLVSECCSNICKSKLRGVSIGDDRFHDRVIQATSLCMHYILDNGKRPSKLSSFCYLPCIGILYGKAAKTEDSEVSLDQQEEYQNTIGVDILGNIIEDENFRMNEEENIRGICRPELMSTLD